MSEETHRRAKEALRRLRDLPYAPFRLDMLDDIDKALQEQAEETMSDCGHACACSAEIARLREEIERLYKRLGQEKDESTRYRSGLEVASKALDRIWPPVYDALYSGMGITTGYARAVERDVRAAMLAVKSVLYPVDENA